MKIINENSKGHEKKCEKVKVGSEGAVTLGIPPLLGLSLFLSDPIHTPHVSSLSSLTLSF